MLPLAFDDAKDYDRRREGDKITLVGVEEGEMVPGEKVMLE